MKNTLIECSCESVEHIIKLTYFTDEKDLLYVEHYLQSWSFFRRLWVAIKYVFGYRSRYGDFGEHVWGRVTVAQVRDKLNEFLEEDK